jgi:3-dehydroquinate synthase
MQAIRVKLPENSYDVVISDHRIESLGEVSSQLKLGKKVLLVSNPDIFGYYGDRVVHSLQDVGFEVSTHLIPAGETHKTLQSIEKIYDVALENYLERSSTMIALGGGVVGDMTGFAAATWLRGINFIQVPTSLLAMVDASIGGKTGVNHPRGKNLIGAFYQPKLVFIDPLVLKTLPEREFRAGMAEVIKYGIIWDAELFAALEGAERLDKLEYLSPELLEMIITRSCQAKVDVVSQDEKEAGLRAILNYGHTIGHAVESLTGYSEINHGEAVAIGMVSAGQLAVELGMWSQTEADRQKALIEKTGLPVKIPNSLNPDEIIETLKSDKKVKSGIIRFILPEAIGKATISDRVTADAIVKVIEMQRS